LIVFDFLYYLTHRFVFHGKLMRREHSLHHQAHTPTHIDALYVHPLETTVGLLLFLGSIPIVGLATGGPLNAFSMAIATLIFTQTATINHAFIDLPYFPFKRLDHRTSVHAAHHVDMSSGNYAQITTIFDRMFGTFEQPVSRSEP
jgi:sterol desaturase/sphingolipid hydroxylase (fatty acid hydroxylase superfamily)